MASGVEVVDAYLEYEHHLLFEHLSFTIPGNHWTCLLGPSGVGKSSLLRLIAGLKTDASTSKPIRTLDGKSLVGNIAYLAQNELLLPWLTAVENVMVGANLRGEKIDDLQIARAQELLAKVGLQKHIHHLPAKLSGGMKQRVLLARTLFEDKPIILMDEPFAALDVITRTSIQELAAALLRERTVLLVTHDPLEALRLGHHIYVMSGKPATLTAKIELPGEPPRELTNDRLLHEHAEILQTLSHAKEVMEC